MTDIQTLTAIADYLTNALDRDCDQEMATFLIEAFGLSTQDSDQLVKAFIRRYSTSPIIFENEAIEFIGKQLGQSNIG